MNARIQPTFICAGAMKAGTTSLHDLLRRHPKIYLPEEKELHFFDMEERYAKGLDWYLKTYFAECPGDSVAGEITPSYMYIESVAARLANDLGADLKIVVLLRDPVERAFSHYMHNVEKGRETESFMRALELEAGRIVQPFPNNAHFSYIDRGRYARQIRHLMKFFAKENFHYLVFERDIRDGSDSAIVRLQEFLGVEPLQLGPADKKNETMAPRNRTLNRLSKIQGIRNLVARLIPAKTFRGRLRQWMNRWNTDSGYKREFTAQLKAELYRKYYRDELVETEELTGCDLSHWRR